MHGGTERSDRPRLPAPQIDRTTRRVDPAGGRGRHRRPRRTPGRPALAVLVTLPLLALGAGALLRPAGLVAADPGPGATAGRAADAAGESSDRRADPESPLRARGTTAPPGPKVTPTRRPTATPARTAVPPSRRAARVAPTATVGSAPPAAATATVEEQVITLVNRERASNGCAAVAAQPQLADAARRHSQDQAAHASMSHTGSDGSSPWDRAERSGYTRAIGENVAAGYRTADAVMTGWMNSDGHRANILNCQAKAIGVGLAAASDGTIYWTQMFGSAI
ncbi:CAP domain-containing protein [Micromonospora sp. NPDC049679]|uniref:CAP domain-containing protein n=1 Tax=Micromonospora sp. NPDC049679 TaxID=3155920 RepID=UPI0033F33BAF